MLLGQARGKIGDIVLYVRNGVQQARPRNRKPANPQTINQMNQRVKMAAPVGFYKRNSPFFKMAFRKSERESFYNAFIRLNINIGPYLTREQVVDGYKAPAPYIIADGNMPSIAISEVSMPGDNRITLITSMPSSLTTWSDVRNYYNLVYGDMLTLVTFNSAPDRDSLSSRVIVQHIFDVASDSLPVGYDMSGTSWSVVGTNKAVTMESEYWGLPYWQYTGSAIVLSRNAGAVDCSYAQLALNPDAQSLYEELRTDAARQIAVASYAAINDAVLDPTNAEGNEDEFAVVYADGSRTTVITSINIPAGDTDTVYLQTGLLATATSASSQLLTGSDVLDDVEVTVSNSSVTIGVQESTYGTGVYKLSFKNSSNHIVAQSILTITCTQA